MSLESRLNVCSFAYAMKKRIQYLTLLSAVLLSLPFAYAQDGAMAEGDLEEVVDVDAVESGQEAASPRKEGEVPAMFRDDAMLDDSHSNQELGINVYTAPSISKIFDQLDNLPAIPEGYVLRKRPEKLPTDAGSLALEMGYLLADGFLAVRSGHMNDVKPIALDLSRYGKALGVGEKMNTHSAGLLEHAEKGQLEEFKKILSNTQTDVNAELASLKDPDLAHLIAFGGWVRALDASIAAVLSKFDEKQAAVIFYPDAPAYFLETLTALNPQTSKKLDIKQLADLLGRLCDSMTLSPGDRPTTGLLQKMQQIVLRISTLAVGAGYEH